jgi:hypothetical protein
MNEEKAARLVIDECHQALTCLEYRHHFEKLRRLADLPIPKSFFCASLPKTMMKMFLETISMPPSIKVIRAKADQPLIQFNVLPIETANTNSIRLAIDLAKLLTLQVLGTRRSGIIFCTSKAEVDQVSERFAHCKSHSDVNKEERNHMEASWFAGYRQWIAATTGMIHGVDNSRVGAVIFIGLPYGLINVYQGAGRAGRNGEPAVCVLISKPIAPVHRTAQEVDVECRREGDKWCANTTQCRRRGLSHLMDGEEIPCEALPGCQLCDMCNPGTPLLLAMHALIPDPAPAPSPSPPAPAPAPATSLALALALALAPAAAAAPTPLPCTRIGSFEDDDDEYASCYEIQDTMLLQIDTEHMSQPRIIPVSTAKSSTVIKSTQSLSSVATQRPSTSKPGIKTMRSLPSGTGNAPSMSVLLDVATLRSKKAIKEAKAQMLNSMVATLHGSCVICWAWKGKVVTKTAGHTPFIHCRDPGEQWNEDGYGWIDFKKKVKLMKYKYCYYCGTPQQAPFRASHHPPFEKGKPMDCPIQDFVILLIWYIRHHQSAWTRAVAAFQERGLLFAASLADFAQWCTSGESDDSFYNGLELIIWYWQDNASQR